MSSLSRANLTTDLAERAVIGTAQLGAIGGAKVVFINSASLRTHPRARNRAQYRVQVSISNTDVEGPIFQKSFGSEERGRKHWGFIGIFFEVSCRQTLAITRTTSDVFVLKVPSLICWARFTWKELCLLTS